MSFCYMLSAARKREELLSKPLDSCCVNTFHSTGNNAINLCAVLVSYYCYNKSPQEQDIYYFSILEVRRK